jgi:hypothetical protein
MGCGHVAVSLQVDGGVAVLAQEASAGAQIAAGVASVSQAHGIRLDAADIDMTVEAVVQGSASQVRRGLSGMSTQVVPIRCAVTVQRPSSIPLSPCGRELEG